jgi:hypothetical protein
MVTTTAAVPDTPKPMGAGARLIGALVSPRATFEDIARNPSWLLPLVVMIVVALATTFLIGQRIGWRAVIEKQIAHSASAQRHMAQMPPDQREHVLELQTKIAPYFGYAANIIVFPLVCLLIAAVMMGVLNGTSSAGLDFRTSFGIVTHGYLPGVVGFLLGIGILYLKPPDQVDIQNLVASNAGAFVSNDAAHWLQTLAISIDLFSFWIIGLIAFGYAVARPKKVSMGKALICMIAIWAVYVLIRVGFAAAFS